MATPIDTFVRDRLPPPEQLPTLLLDRPEQQWPAQLNVVDWLFDEVMATVYCPEGKPLIVSG